MPVCLGRSLPSAWTSRVLEVCQTISCKPATSGEYSKPLPWQQAQQPEVQAESLLMSQNRQKMKATAQPAVCALPFASPLDAYSQ